MKFKQNPWGYFFGGLGLIAGGIIAFFVLTYLDSTSTRSSTSPDYGGVGAAILLFGGIALFVFSIIIIIRGEEISIIGSNLLVSKRGSRHMEVNLTKLTPEHWFYRPDTSSSSFLSFVGGLGKTGLNLYERPQGDKMVNLSTYRLKKILPEIRKVTCVIPWGVLFSEQKKLAVLLFPTVTYLKAADGRISVVDESTPWDFKTWCADNKLCMHINPASQVKFDHSKFRPDTGVDLPVSNKDKIKVAGIELKGDILLFGEHT